jgi:hypothetical protein
MSKASVLYILKQNMSTFQSENIERYKKVFVCSDVLKEILKRYFEEASISLSQANQWIGSDGSFGRSIQLSLPMNQKLWPASSNFW